MEMRGLFILGGALLGMVAVVAALLFCMGEVSPSMPYETALPFLLAGGVAGLLGGGYLGGWLHRDKWRAAKGKE